MSEENQIICPYCHEEVDHLVEKQSVVVDYDFYKDGEYSKESIIDDDYPVGEDVNDYCCPECDEVIATNEEDAKRFLQTGRVD